MSCLYTALLDAARAGNTDEAEKWLEQGIKPDAMHETLADWTPLHYAAQLGHVEIIHKLLDRGAEKRPRDRNGET